MRITIENPHCEKHNRPKYVTDIIDNINLMLRNNNVRDEGNMLFFWLQQYLLDKNMYHGFNYFSNKEFEGKYFRVLAGSCIAFDYLQIM